MTLDLHSADPTSSVLVAVMNSPAAFDLAQHSHWYRLPLDFAPKQIACSYLAWYQTGAFPPDERWSVRWLAGVTGFRLATRRELLPGEPHHPRAERLYYQITLSELHPLPQPILSRRLRRITFIRTTLGRLLDAHEVNDLWTKSTAQERLWQAFREINTPVERQYPLHPDHPEVVADFAVFSDKGRAALIVEDEPPEPGDLRERAAMDYFLASGGWLALRVTQAEILSNPAQCARAFAALVV
jgi:hypothetical protein